MSTMIDVNKIRSMKTLEGIRKLISDFMAFDQSTMVSVYAEEYGWDAEDYEADKECASALLEQVERRMKSLGRHLAKGGKSVPQSHDPLLDQEQPSEVS